ncbi:acyl-protein thioesterase 1-like isoform X2 [Salvia miltiorrhiza]|uniref:acyl-protein thioesterase 1-like isoform X2 n=1 Tax=Salvia miltiorrhiza TaxID=226208 RepID=UPI0025ABD8DA|nr:acyl-protein thioesterase 1-like isoform X2 [Salvia miltiorrhiza]
MATSSSPRGRQNYATALQFGPTHVKMPKGRHQATIVWLHGLGDSGSIWAEILGSFPVHNVKWICPTAPTRPVPIFARLPGRAWFDPRDVSEEDTSPDSQGLNETAALIAQIFSREPCDVKLGIGGFSIGAAAALYAATHYILGEDGSRLQFLENLSSVIVLSGWLPFYKSLRRKMDGSSLSNVLHVKQLHVFLGHGTEDEVVSFEHGEKSACILHSAGFQNLTWTRFEGDARNVQLA